MCGCVSVCDECILCHYVCILVSWLRGGSKEKLCLRKPCSTGQWYITGHQTGFIVRIDCVTTRQEISNHVSIAYNMLYCTMCTFIV